MFYLGIDASYTGLALVAYDPAHGHVKKALGDFSKAKAGFGIARLHAIQDWVEEELMLISPSMLDFRHICMEGYSRGSQNRREEAGELQAIIKGALYSMIIDNVRFPTLVPPTSLKKYCTGNGAAPKSIVIKEVLRKWGKNFDDDNLADAYVLARMAHALDNPDVPRLGYEDQVLKALTMFTELPAA